MKRKAFYKVKEVMDNYKIPILIGLRRTGKSEILKQLKQEHGPSATILRFDTLQIKAMNTLEIWNYIETIIKGGTTLLLLDEVQAIKEWDLIIKNIFDEYTSREVLKVVVTASSSLSFESRDTGVDRTEKVLITTLDFEEYRQLSNKEKSKDNFEEYLGSGAFPEYVNKEIDDLDILKARLLELIINEDIPSNYKIDSNNLSRALMYLANLSSGELNKNIFSKNTGISINQLNKYIEILEKTQIIKTVKFIKINGTHPKYERIKVYINPHFHLWILNKSFKDLSERRKGHIIEAYWLFAATQINGYYKSFYYTKNDEGLEIDFISLDSSGFKTLHEFKYNDNPVPNKLFYTTPSKNKVIWSLVGPKTVKGIKYENIIKY